MSFDNRIFNVNGKSKQDLLSALNLAFSIEGDNTKCAGWSESKEHGLILHWYIGSDTTPFMEKLTADACFPMINSWLQGDFAKTVSCKDRDADADHDGHNGSGWRVYLGDWGHVGNCTHAICAVKPVHLWYEK